MRQIVRLVKEGNSLQAKLVAQYGKQLSPVAMCLYALYWYGDMEAVMKSQDQMFPFKQRPTPIFARNFGKFCKMQHATARKELCKLFLDAVDHHKRDFIIELAEAVWFFRDKRIRNSVADDVTRTQLLLIKPFLEKTSMCMTIADLAGILGIQPTEDGYSSLRRKCKEVEFPLCPARKISVKNRLKVLKKSEPSR